MTFPHSIFKAYDIRGVHAHPTLSEAFHEAALSVTGRALHKVN